MITYNAESSFHFYILIEYFLCFSFFETVNPFIDSKPNPSIKSEAYIGPPPPLPLSSDQVIAHSIKTKPQHIAKATVPFNKIPIFRNKPLFMQNKSPTHMLSALPPHQVIANQMHLNQIRAIQHNMANKEQNRLVRPNVIPINHVIHDNLVHFKHPQPSVRIQPVHVNMPTPHINQHPNTHMHEYVINNVAGGMNDIIEIQRIPEGK